MVTSFYNKQHYIEKFAYHNEVEVVHDMINVHYFEYVKTQRKESRKIVCVCRFVEKKGVRFLIEACRILKSRGQYFECVLIGEGELRNRYKKLIAAFNLQQYFVLKGMLTQMEIREELIDAEIFVLPCIIVSDGDRDILPNVLKEAMAMEIPVVTSNICGIEELVQNNEHGLLTMEKDAVGLADAIERLFRDKKLRKKLGRKGREMVDDKFNFDKESQKLEKVFLKVINNTNG